MKKHYRVYYKVWVGVEMEEGDAPASLPYRVLEKANGIFRDGDGHYDGVQPDFIDGPDGCIAEGLGC